MEIHELIEMLRAKRDQYPDSVVYDIPEDGDYDHRVLDEYVAYARVCTRKSIEEAAEWLTEVRPPGNRFTRWVPAKDIPWVRCDDHPDTHRHVIVEC